MGSGWEERQQERERDRESMGRSRRERHSKRHEEREKTERNSENREKQRKTEKTEKNCEKQTAVCSLLATTNKGPSSYDTSQNEKCACVFVCLCRVCYISDCKFECQL